MIEQRCLLLLLLSSQLLTANRLLLQPQTLRGAYGQICMLPAPDVMCPTAQTRLSDQGTGIIECGTEYDCCLCAHITCAMCDSFKAGAEYAAFGVKSISIVGEANKAGAIVDCNAFAACAEVYMIGSWISQIQCGAEDACRDALMDFSMSNGVLCGDNSCTGATFLLATNRGGQINCISDGACLEATIEIAHIEKVQCNGVRSCSNAKMTVTDPSEHFNLDCNGDLACENLELNIIINSPFCVRSDWNVMAEPLSWKGITCASNAACVGLRMTVENNGCKPINIEDLQCTPDRSCFGAIFSLNTGTGPDTTIQNCLCGPSCMDATGIDACYDNLRTFACMDPVSCANQIHTIVHPSNDFEILCLTQEACLGLELTVFVYSQNIIRRISAVLCQDIGACQNAVFDFRNQQRMTDGVHVTVVIETIECSAFQSCHGATFIVGTNNNVLIGNIICADGACGNCRIKATKSSVGIPCDANNPILITANPTPKPTVNPTVKPTLNPTVKPSLKPTTTTATDPAVTAVTAVTVVSIPSISIPIPEVPSIPPTPTATPTRKPTPPNLPKEIPPGFYKLYY